MHEDETHVCLLGCSDTVDSLTHYIHCPHLYAMQKFLFEDISDDPTVRFGIKSPDSKSFKVISCLFSAYHAVKAKVRAGSIIVHHETMKNSTLRATWSVFADAFRAEAGEMRVQTRAFSLPKFMTAP